MGVQQPQFAVFDDAVGVLQIGPPGADGLHLSAGEHDSGLELFQQKIKMRGGAVLGGIALAASHRIALYIFRLLRTYLMRGLAWHGTLGGVAQTLYPSTASFAGLRCYNSGFACI